MYKTPSELYLNENDETLKCEREIPYRASGFVKYVREDYVPNDEEMLDFAEQMSKYIDDRLCPYSRQELRSRAWLDGYYFAKRRMEKLKEEEVNMPMEEEMMNIEFSERMEQLKSL